MHIKIVWGLGYLFAIQPLGPVSLDSAKETVRCYLCKETENLCIMIDHVYRINKNVFYLQMNERTK